jgi:Spy/CpxP family protein refolding chaperone
MEKDKFLVVTIIILFILNLFTLGYVLFGKDEPFFPIFSGERPGPEGRMEDLSGPRDKGPDGRKPDLQIINRLKLTPDQILKFEELKKEHRKQADELIFQGKKLRDEYFSLLKSEFPDSAKASSLLNAIAENQKQLDKATFAHFKKLKELCDGDQKKLFDIFIEELAASLKPPIPQK